HLGAGRRGASSGRAPQQYETLAVPPGENETEPFRSPRQKTFVRCTVTSADSPGPRRPAPLALTPPDVPVTRQFTGPPWAAMRTLHDDSRPRIRHPSTARLPRLGVRGASLLGGGCSGGRVLGVLDALVGDGVGDGVSEGLGDGDVTVGDGSGGVGSGSADPVGSPLSAGAAGTVAAASVRSPPPLPSQAMAPAASITTPAARARAPMRGPRRRGGRSRARAGAGPLGSGPPYPAN